MAVISRMLKVESASNTRPAARSRTAALLPAVGLVLLVAAVFSKSLAELANLGLNDDRYTYILLVPFVVAALLWVRLKEDMPDPEIRFRPAGLAILVILAGITLVFGSDWTISTRIAMLVFLTWGAVVTACGVRLFQQALFPILLLAGLIPLPPSWMTSVVATLQLGSADITHGLFKLIGVPVHREGPFVFSLPGFAIEVAEECSGIRSTTSLLVSSFVATYLTLDKAWKRALVVLLVVPVSVFKNAVRIVTIASLGVYVDRAFLFGKLHHMGGIPFSMIAMFILGGIIMLLRRKPASTRPSSGGPVEGPQ